MLEQHSWVQGGRHKEFHLRGTRHPYGVDILHTRTLMNTDEP